jgi:dTDP-4-dehydrorhamnose 3,5-epimerase
MLQIFPTEIPDVLLIQPKVFRDARGFFLESYNEVAFKTAGLGDLHFVQDNLSSSQKGTIRGLHFQLPPYAQGKLVSVFQGKVLDVAVDIRKGSPYYGKHIAVELDAEKMQFLYIPPGFAHGFQVLSETCLFYYKCTNTYHSASDAGLLWCDTNIAIPWRELDTSPIISEKDSKQMRLADFDSPFTYISQKI